MNPAPEHDRYYPECLCGFCREARADKGGERCFVEDGNTFTELIRQEYAGNACVISAGFVGGDNKPEVDTCYLRLEKDGVDPTVLLLRPDEIQCIAWVASGTVWSHLMQKKHAS